MAPPTAPCRTAFVFALVLLLCMSLIETPAHAATAPGYAAPVDAPVVDPFRPPATPYGPGNRGLEYATARGTPVHAAADGEVVFAGAVAGSLFVTVLHADGVRTTYSFLATIAVHRPDRVAQGDVVGTAGERLFFSARLGDVYLDPAVLLAAGPLHVHLVPDAPEPAPANGATARGAIRQLTSAVVDWARTPLIGLASSPFAHYLAESSPAPHLLRLGAAAVSWRRLEGSCTPDRVAVGAPAAGHVALLVGGLGSSSERAAVDTVETGALGFARRDVVRFSYRGGLVPDGTDRPLGLTSNAYRPADTLGDLGAEASKLADVLEQLAAAAPGVPIDLIAHSQGGVVAHAALLDLAQRGTSSATAALAALEVLVTLAAPHRGADLATAVAALRASPGGVLGLEATQAIAGLDLKPGSTAIAELGETSALTDALLATPLPNGLDVVSIGARGDLVVPAGRTRLPGATNVIVDGGGPLAHDELPGSAAATREIGLAVAHRPPSCEGLLDALADEVVSDSIGWFEDALGATFALIAAGTTG